jgi:tRNA(fMet)-specific endonuclease VapC
MRYLLDTNAVSALMRDDRKLLARLNQVVLPDVAIICPIVRGEILYGIERVPAGKRRQQLYEVAMRVLPQFVCEPMTSTVGDIYSKLKRGCEANGVAASDNDLWIAATAEFNSATVVTRDADFARIPGVHVEDWTL